MAPASSRLTITAVAVAASLRGRDVPPPRPRRRCSRFAVFYLVALVVRGGFGMGDEKLAAMPAFLLGVKVVPALAIGGIAGGVWAAALLLSRRATARTAFAYGPFLCLRAAAAIPFSNPPPLV